MFRRLLIPIMAVLLLGTNVSAEESNNPRVRLTTTHGDIVLELNRSKAPKSVENFLTYVADGYYNGTIFHRVIRGFMNQGGGFTADFQKKTTRNTIKNEADNGLKNDRGTIAMARTSDPHSATSQFFINTVDNNFLNFTGRNARGWGYAVFGRVIEGMDVVNSIANTPTGSGGPFPRDVPRQTIVIKKATLEAVTAEKAS